MGRTAGLALSRVVEAALVVADREGIDRLSMRRVAATLDVTPMALYHHVRDKEGLLDLVADQSLASLLPLAATGEAATRLVEFFTALHRLHLDHPAVAHVMARRPLEGPTATAIAEQLLEMLIGHGLRDDEAALAVVNLVNYTFGSSLYRLSRSGRQESRLAGVTAASSPTAHRLRSAMAAAAEDETAFLDGLQRLVDSYLSRASGRTAGGPASPRRR